MGGGGEKPIGDRQFPWLGRLIGRPDPNIRWQRGRPHFLLSGLSEFFLLNWRAGLVSFLGPVLYWVHHEPTSTFVFIYATNHELWMGGLPSFDKMFNSPRPSGNRELADWLCFLCYLFLLLGNKLYSFKHTNTHKKNSLIRKLNSRLSFFLPSIHTSCIQHVLRFLPQPSLTSLPPKAKIKLSS